MILLKKMTKKMVLPKIVIIISTSTVIHVLVTFVAVVVSLLRFHFSRAGQAMAERDLR